MPAERSDGSPISLSAYSVVALVLAAAGYYYWAEPLKSSRPSEVGDQLAGLVGEGKVRARLWQDPLETARHARDQFPPTGQDEVIPATLQEILKDQDLFLPVTVSGSNWFEDREFRLRTRYAVQAALDEAGYLPADRDYLHFVVVQWPPPEDPDIKTAPIPGRPQGRSDLVIPFEFWERDELREGLNTKRKTYPHDRILVLWIDNGAIERQPLMKTLQILRLVEGSGSPGEPRLRHDVRVIGPAYSDSLNEMAQELKNSRVLACFRHLTVYSPWATAHGSLLGLGQDSAAQIKRTIATDQDLASKLVSELKNRGIDFGEDQIAIVAERDTFYGRALPLTFAACFLLQQPKEQSRPPNFESAVEKARKEGGWPEALVRVIYSRGLDGLETPAVDAEKKGTDPQKSVANKEDKEDREEQLERPIGRSQLDYARRLAEKLSLEDRGKRIKAIGVVGSDVYDKLLLLQALRPRFPHALFFTTDLDARFLHPSQKRWTQNLIVASGFGLDPNSDKGEEERDAKRSGNRQATHDIRPPFRDGYQTATYFSTLSALQNQYAQPVSPQLYEVGRTQLYELQDKWPGFGWTSHEWLAGLTLLLLCWLLRQLRHGPAQRHALAVTVGSFAVIVLLVGVFAFAVSGRDGPGPPEPFALLDGVSIWPTELLRLIAAFFCFRFLVKAHSNLRSNEEALCREFSLPAIEPAVNSRLFGRDWWKQAFCSVVKDWSQPSKIGGLWQEYLACGRTSLRWGRVAVLSFVYLIFAYMLFDLFGYPTVPGRGGLAFVADLTAVIVSVILLILLIFFVVDATLLCERFVKRVTAHYTEWPESSCVATRKGASTARFPAAWWASQLIARRTEAVTALIWYPFLILPVMVLARVSLFDRWDWPPSLIAVFGINSIFAIGCALLLRRAAEESRQTFVRDLRRKQIGVEGPQGNDQLKVIEDSIADIEGEHRGAFAPLAQQPVLRALLLPFGGVGAAVFLDSFTSPF